MLGPAQSHLMATGFRIPADSPDTALSGNAADSKMNIRIEIKRFVQWLCVGS
jgi:hypothetical protein